MARKSRAAVQAASGPLRTPTPHIADISDDNLPETRQSVSGTPADEEGDEPEEPELGEEAEDENGTPANDSEPPSHRSTPARGQATRGRKRRLGRPPKNRHPDWDTAEEGDPRDATSDLGTPKKRGGWRGRGFGSGRWGRSRGGPSHVTQVPLDKEGNMANVRDDEVELPEDAEGETKVDKMGRLQEGREYRVRVFTISGKGERLYMLSTEPARCIGFRDSYLFFQKHRQLYKIILAEEAKKDLIERGVIPHSYKGRAIGVVTARSVFREFGSRIIIGGRKIVDDYQVAAARANGDIEGDLAVPDDTLPITGENYDRNRYVAWHGASSVYHSGAPSVPLPSGKVADGKKRKVIVTDVNWMLEHAREASRFNSVLATNRRQNLNGVYDPHTNVMQYPGIMQPTHGRWEQVPPPDILSEPTMDNASDHDDATVGNTTVDDRDSTHDGPKQPSESIFTDVAPVYSQNYLITDTYYATPPVSGLGVPGPDGSAYDIGPRGLADVDESIIAELPEECREPFFKARDQELEWKKRWSNEEEQASRKKIRIRYNS